MHVYRYQYKNYNRSHDKRKKRRRILPVTILIVAAAVLDRELMSGICQKIGADTVCVLPSSIHEMIVAPVKEGTDLSDTEELYSMVEDVNATAIPECDVLTTNVYTYSINDGLQIAGRC